MRAFIQGSARVCLLLVGIVPAFIGTAIARAIGIPTATSGID
jgi:hypothetical protein